MSGAVGVWRAWCPADGEAEEFAKEYPHKPCRSAQDVAELYAGKHDEACDGDIVKGGELVVHVRSPEGELTRWEVTGEWDPVYFARELDPLADTEPAPALAVGGAS